MRMINFLNYMRKLLLKKILTLGLLVLKIKLIRYQIVKYKKKFKILCKASVKIDNLKKYFIIPNNFKNNIYNILAALAVISLYTDIFRLKFNTFLKFKTPSGRGD